MKKLLALLLVLIMAAACLAGCVAPSSTPEATPDATPTPATPDTTPMDTLKVLEFSVMEHGLYAANTTQYLLEEWGLKCTKVIRIGGGDGTYDFDEDMLRLFAGNDTPDWIPRWNFNWQNEDSAYKTIGDEGKLVNFLPYVEAGKLDNYVNNIWGDALYAWDFAKKCLGSRTTGNLYILPIRNYEVAYYTWLYNKHYFETELNMEAPPTDLAEVVTIMKTFATENPGLSAMLYDWGPSYNDTWGYWGYFEREPIFNACGVLHSSEWRTHNGAPEYAPMAKGYLEAISTYRNLMNSKTIFAVDSQNFNSGISLYSNKQDALQHNGAIFAWDNFGSLADINNKAKAGNSNYEWAVVPQDPSFEGLEPVAYNSIPFSWNGKVIGTTASKELVERFIAFMDWSATPEGEMRQQFGIEGISYELVDGKVKFLKYYNDTYTPEMKQTPILKEQLDYYRFGLEHKYNYDFIANYTVYDSPKYQYQKSMEEKITGMIHKGQCNYPGAWGNEDAAAKAVGRTAEEMEKIEKEINAIVKAWRNDFYAGRVNEDSYAKMQRDVLNAGYIIDLAYREHLLVAAISANR